jgi:putative tryptophan/tyrosine transport system substrate-binding protein
MRRRDFITLLGSAGAAWPLAAHAQERRAMPIVGVLMPGIPGVANPADSFFAGMRDLGYVEGRNLVYEMRWGRGSDEALLNLAGELVALKPNVIVVGGGRAIDAVRRATKTIPVVVPFAGDLVGPGFVSSLARPEGNITGLSAMSSEISAKRIELLKEAFPKLVRLAVVWNSALSKEARWDVTEATARALAIELRSMEIAKPAAFDEASADISVQRIDAIYMIHDRFLLVHRARAIALAAKHRLPAMYDFRDYPDAGGLMSYGPNRSDMHRRGAVFVDKILRGAKPADLPIEQPTKFELVVNLKTAKSLGLDVPPILLARADEVIE